MSFDAPHPEPMTDTNVETLANELRAMIQQRTCCPMHAGQVLLYVMASFALDDAGDDKVKAARTMELGARAWVKRLRKGEFSMVRRDVQ